MSGPYGARDRPSQNSAACCRTCASTAAGRECGPTRAEVATIFVCSSCALRVLILTRCDGSDRTSGTSPRPNASTASMKRRNPHRTRPRHADLAAVPGFERNTSDGVWGRRAYGRAIATADVPEGRCDGAPSCVLSRPAAGSTTPPSARPRRHPPPRQAAAPPSASPPRRAGPSCWGLGPPRPPSRH